MTISAITPDDILDFWLPDGPNPAPEAHMDHRVWRMQGGAHQAVIAVAEALIGEAPERLRELYQAGVRQPKKHRAVIAQFGCHPHRKAIFGRVSTPQEVEYLAAGVFPHQTDLRKVAKGEA